MVLSNEEGNVRNRRKGFALYLAFVVTTVLFFMALGSLDLSKTAIDLSRSTVLDTVSFHSADGGLEIGLARLRKKFVPFRVYYSSVLQPGRAVHVEIEAKNTRGKMSPPPEILDLSSEATVFEGNKLVARRKLFRSGIADGAGRKNCGIFSEGI